MADNTEIDGKELEAALSRLSPFDDPTLWRKSFTVLAAEKAPMALGVLTNLLNSDNPMAQIMACKLILQYGLGSPVAADKHDAVNHRILDGQKSTQSVRWSTVNEVKDAAMERAKDDQPITLQPLLNPPAGPANEPEATKAPQEDPEAVPDDYGAAANEQPGVMAPLPIVDVAKLFGEERGIATDGAGESPTSGKQA